MPVLKVNLDACQGYATCVVAASDVYDLDDDGKRMLITRRSLVERLRPMAAAA